MSRVLIDGEGLDWTARRLAQAGADLGEAARDVAALAARLPPVVSALYAEASSPIVRGLEVEAGAMVRLAAELRLVRRAVELAQAGGFDPGLATEWSDGWRRRRPPFTPPAAAGSDGATDEEVLRWLRMRLAWRIASGPGGLFRVQLAATGTLPPRKSTGTGAAGGAAAVAILLALFMAAAMAASGSGSGTTTGATTSPPKTPDPSCDAVGHGNDVDKAKAVLLDKRHIDAVKRERQGQIVHTKADGTPSDHVTEYRQEQVRVRKRIGELKGIIGNSRCSAEDKATAQRELSDASKLLDWTENNVLPEKS
jgi:hypothetical protein